MEIMSAVAKDNIALLMQGRELILDLDDRSFQDKPASMTSDSIGSHMRHVIEHYLLFLDGLDAGQVDYEQRKRDQRIAVDRSFASRKIDEIILGLQELKGDVYAFRLNVKFDCGSDSLWALSSPLRELQFLFSHHLHHNAIIRVMLENEGVSLPDHFGFAPSTIKYKEKQTYVHSNMDE